MVFGWLEERRRKKILSTPFPEAWLQILERNMAHFRCLDAGERGRLSELVQLFIADKEWEGCGGLELTEEIRVTIAAQACVLLLHRETDYYPELTSILVYPSGYVAREERHVGGGIWEEGGEDRLGHTAPGMKALVLAWDSARHGAADPGGGSNLILHEFAHQLDFENREVDGVPALDTHGEYVAWGRIMRAEFDALRRAQDANAPTLLDTYGATSPAEFFAVCTEAFFERPKALRSRHPALYAELRRFFRQDPAAYSGELAPD